MENNYVIVEEKIKNQSIKVENLENQVNLLQKDVKILEDKVTDLTGRAIKNSEQTISLFNAVEQMTQSTKEISHNFQVYNDKLEDLQTKGL